MKNHQSFEPVVGFFLGYNNSPYKELHEIVDQLNEAPGFTAYSFTDIKNMLSSTTHVVLRHATGYYRNYSAFQNLLDYLDERGIKTINPGELIRWNADKRYLRDLPLNSLRIPETHFFTADEFKNPASDIHQSAIMNQTAPLVLKPTRSASGWNTFLTDHPEIEQITRTIEDSSIDAWMIQEFIPEIKTSGELSLVFLDGELLHGVHKMPAKNEFKSQPEYGSSVTILDDLSPQLIKVVKEDVLNPLSPSPFYARVDLIPLEPGPVLMEVECIEPDLLLNDNYKIKRYTELLIYSILNQN